LATKRRLKIFVLDLSFWFLYPLGALALGVGAFFIMPYHEATVAGLYRCFVDIDSRPYQASNNDDSSSQNTNVVFEKDDSDASGEPTLEKE